jgi:hypothetical protein
MEVKIGNRRLKMIDGKVCIVKFSGLGVEVKSGKFTPIKFSDHAGYNLCGVVIDGRPTSLLEHRLVWKLAHPDWDLFDTSPDNQIDHKNRNRRDNRLENLHVVNHQQNNFNRSDVKGYTLDKRNGKYQAYIMIDGVTIGLGMYATEEEAHAAYLQGKIKYHVIV